MITVHHLNNSRSHRILWLLEELGIEYEIVRHQRDATTNLAPPALKEVHPLGKSPVLVDDGEAVIESGAIIDHVVRLHGKGRLAPGAASKDYSRYNQLLHYAEGSAMLPMMLRLYTSRLGDAGAPLMPRIDSETDNHLGYLDGLLEGRTYFVGDDFSGADIQLSFVVEVANLFGRLAPYENLKVWLARMKARPAYQAAIERGGPYAF